MTNSVDSYWRKIEDLSNNLENSIQISSILLKLKELDNKINNIENDIDSNSIRIEQNENNIVDILPSLKVFENKYDIENKEFYFDKNTNIFSILEIEINENFNNGMLHIKSDISYKYNDLKNDMYRSCHFYQFVGDDDLFYEIFLNKYNFGQTDFDNNIFHIKDDFYVKIDKDYNKIKILVSLARMYKDGTVEYKLKHINKNLTNIKYYNINKTILKINENEKNISNNLINMKINEDNIEINKNDINNLKKSSNYLKNHFNEILHNKRIQIGFNEYIL